MLGRTNTGGGGASLNFKVVGNPRPENPKENTIWIDTDTPIDGWTFSAAQPENPTEGMAWITVGTSSAAAFNALKKNSIMVYPISAKQYVSGAWVGVIAMVYQNGEWIRAGALYWRGSQCEKITGGWVQRGVVSGNYSQVGTVTFEEESMVLTATAKSGQYGQGHVYTSTQNMIDLTDINTIYVNVPTKNANDCKIGIHNANEQWKLDNTTSVAASRINAVGITSVDVSALTGSYYIAVLLYTTSQSVAESVSVGEVYWE